MNEYLAVILIIIIAIIFSNLNTKIRKLEKEVSDLTSKINKQTIHPEIPQEAITSEETITSPTPIHESHGKVILPSRNREESTKLQKDWLEPIFEFL